MRNPDLGATVTNFMAILQSIDYSKFERSSTVVDEISIVCDQYGFKFSEKTGDRLERKHVHSSQENTQLMCKKLKLSLPQSSYVISKLP